MSSDRHIGGRRRSVRGEVLRFAIPGVVALAVVVAGSLWLARSIATEEARRDARVSADLIARTAIEPNLSDALAAGDPDAVARLDAVVREQVLVSPVITVRLWTADGQIVYSDEPRLIGDHYDLGAEDLDVLQHGGAAAEISDLSKPENRYERGFGELLEVYLPVHTPNGDPLLFEVYQRQASIDSGATRILTAFVPVMVGSLVVLMEVQLILAWRMARRLEQGQRDRERLLTQALDASETERRRIAADLHDGVVQDLVGVSFTLAALSDSATKDDADGDQAGRLTRSAATIRRSVRALRSLLVEIYPPNLAEAGLENALSDLVAATNGWSDTNVSVDPSLDLSPGQKAVVYRVARESLQNVRKHARADDVDITLARVDGSAVLTVSDDGQGFDPDETPEGHVGLRLMADLARESGAHLEVVSAPGAGTTIRLEVPQP